MRLSTSLFIQKCWTKAAAASGVDLETFRQVLDAGPMASTVSRGKLHKLVMRDFAPQAAIRDVTQIAYLVRDQARAAGADALLIDVATRMFATARWHGLSDLDMVAVLQCDATETLADVP